MGQEVSTPISDSTPSRTLSARTVEAVASYIKEGRARKIVVMPESLMRKLSKRMGASRVNDASSADKDFRMV
ncbi:MAG: hypothetical protein LQ345_006627 [Seirophora villosa]|nr:MAG: hypothetical protein LQ345_006627 [Seirophora villosa]